MVVIPKSLNSFGNDIKSCSTLKSRWQACGDQMRRRIYSVLEHATSEPKRTKQPTLYKWIISVIDCDATLICITFSPPQKNPTLFVIDQHVAIISFHHRRELGLQAQEFGMMPFFLALDTWLRIRRLDKTRGFSTQVRSKQYGFGLWKVVRESISTPKYIRRDRTSVLGIRKHWWSDGDSCFWATLYVEETVFSTYLALYQLYWHRLLFGLHMVSSLPFFNLST